MKILYFSQIPWNGLKQRPQFIAEEMADAGCEVDFIARMPPGKGGPRKESPRERLTVRTRTVLPGALRFPAVDRLNARFIRSTTDWESCDFIFLADPRMILCLPDALSVPVVYDCMDRHPDFYTGRTAAYVKEMEQRLCRRADRIIVSSETLRNVLCREYGTDERKITLIRNAAASGFLPEIGVRTAPVPPETDLAYVGTIDEWMDFSVLIRFAETHPETSIVLTGPVRVKPRALPRNIRFPGAVPHEQVKERILGSRLLLLPFRRTGLTDAVDPVKIYEYLSCGKPVLSAPLPELVDRNDLPDRLHFYRDAGDFAVQAEKLLAGSGDTAPDYGFFRRNTWRKRLEQYLAVLSRLNA